MLTCFHQHSAHLEEYAQYSTDYIFRCIENVNVLHKPSEQLTQDKKNLI